LTEYY